MKIGLIVPVFKNFPGLTELMESVDVPVQPIIIPNWRYNLGVSGGWNEGIQRAIESRCDLALICNDDIVFHSGTISKLAVEVWNHGIDLITPVNVRDGAELTKGPEYKPHPDFSCFMIQPEKFVERFGLFDTSFSPAYFEDNDMHYRIKLAGGDAYCRTDAGFMHFGSVTQFWGGTTVVTPPMFNKNREYYVAKWGGTPGNEKYTTPFGRE